MVNVGYKILYVYIEKERSEKYLTKMESNKSLEKNIHYIMSVVGGFLGAYALLNRCETFGSSQTSNMIYLVMNILGRNREDVLFRIIAVFIYMGAISLTVIVPKYYKNINTKVSSQFFFIDEVFDIVNFWNRSISKKKWRFDKNKATVFKYYDENDLEPWKFVKRNRFKLILKDFIVKKYRLYIVYLMDKFKK